MINIVQLTVLWGVVISSNSDTVLLGVDTKSHTPVQLVIATSDFPCDKTKGTSFFIQAHDNLYYPKTKNPIIVCENTHAGE